MHRDSAGDRRCAGSAPVVADARASRVRVAALCSNTARPANFSGKFGRRFQIETCDRRPGAKAAQRSPAWLVGSIWVTGIWRCDAGTCIAKASFR